MAASPALRCSALAFTLLILGASADLSKHLTDSLVDDADKATIGQLIAEGGGISTEVCGGSDDALHVKHVEVEPDALVAVVRGTLTRALGGGTVSAKMKLNKPDSLSMGQHLKYVAATAFTRARTFSEPLCQHLGLTTGDAVSSEESCAIPAGQQELRLGFQKLPEVVFAGKYDLEIRVADEAGLPVACIRGALTVKPGKSKSIMRKLETGGCPQLIMENLDSVNAIHVNNDCEGPENKMDLNFEMKPGTDFWMAGHWYGFCKNPEDTMFRMWKRKTGLWIMCDPSAADPCAWLGCSGVKCELNGDDPTPKCMPSHEETHPGKERCESDGMEYHLHPDEVSKQCYAGAPVMVSTSPPRVGRSPASVAALLLVSSALPLALRA